MKVHTLKCSFLKGELIQNTYILEVNNKYFIIDASVDVNDILKIVKQNKIDAIFITHCHYDHIKNIKQYDENFNCPIYVNINSEKFLLDYNLNLSEFFGNKTIFNLNNIKYFNDNQIINFDDVEVKCIYTPGHTDDSSCFLFNNSILFTGDTLFKNSFGATHFLTGDNNKLKESLNKILSLNFDKIYPGHMESSTKNEEEKNIKYFLEYIN